MNKLLMCLALIPLLFANVTTSSAATATAGLTVTIDNPYCITADDLDLPVADCPGELCVVDLACAEACYFLYTESLLSYYSEACAAYDKSITKLKEAQNAALDAYDACIGSGADRSTCRQEYANKIAAAYSELIRVKSELDKSLKEAKGHLEQEFNNCMLDCCDCE